MTQATLFPRPKDPLATWVAPSALPALDDRYRYIGFDAEARSKKKFVNDAVGFSWRLEDGRKFYTPVAHGGGGNLDAATVRRWMTRELRGKHLVGLNTGFDAEKASMFGVDLEGQGCELHDVAFGAALLNEHRYSGLNLDGLAKEYLGPEEGKRPLPFPASQIGEAAAGEVGPYAEHDADLAFRIWEVQRPLIREEGLDAVLELEDSLMWCVNHMERNGARLDIAKARRWRKELIDRRQGNLLKLYYLTGLRVNPDAPDDMARLFTRLGIESDRSTASGKDSFAKEVLLRHVDREEVKLALQAKRFASLLSKYVDKYLRAAEGDVLRFSLHQLRAGEEDYGTITGRFSSANVNIQQVMKVEKQVEEFGDEYIIRELFIPDDDFLWWSADASQIEFRLFAHYSGSASLIDRYNNDPHVDFHQMVAEMIGQVRREAKHNNFGKLYGMGLRKLALRLGLGCVCGGDQTPTYWDRAVHAADCPFIQAIAITENYDAEFPEAKRLLNQASRLAQQRGWVKTLLGRRGRFPEKVGFHAALNKVIQGSAADIMKLKLRALYRDRATLGIHKLRLTVHDEASGDLYPDPRYQALLQEFLDRPALPVKVPILWSLGVGRNWRETA